MMDGITSVQDVDRESEETHIWCKGCGKISTTLEDEPTTH